MWIVETLNETVDAEIADLPRDMRARLTRYSGLIEQFGLQALPAEATKHLDGKLWELRLTGQSGISRAIYITAQGQRVVILRAFIKKTQKTPARELELAGSGRRRSYDQNQHPASGMDARPGIPESL